MANKKNNQFIKNNDLQDFLFNEESPLSVRPEPPVSNRTAKKTSTAAPKGPSSKPKQTNNTQGRTTLKQTSTKNKGMTPEDKANTVAELKARIKAEELEQKKQEIEKLNKQIAQAEELKKKQAAELAKKRQAEELAKKRQAEELAKNKQAEYLAKKEQLEAAKRKQAEELAKKRQAEELARKKQAELIAKKRQAEELAKKKQAEELAKKRQAEELLKQKQAEEFAKQKQAEYLAMRKRATEAAKQKYEAEQLVKAKQTTVIASNAAQLASLRDQAIKRNTQVVSLDIEMIEKEAQEAIRKQEQERLRHEAEEKALAKVKADDAKSTVKDKKRKKTKEKSYPDPSDRNILQKIFLPKEKPVTLKAKALLALRYMAIMFVSCFIIGASYTAFAIATAPKIEPENIYDQIAQSSILYDMNGDEICTVNAGQDRKIVEYDELPENLVHSVVALEDKTFFKHHGFNWVRMVGAVVQAFTNGGHISGTSTITQQLARNVYLAEIKSERSLKRKIIEMYYASKIERTLSKEDIFAAYINSIYFGFGNYGVESAANTYFSKHVSDLNLVECAALAALPQSPDAYAPIEYMTPEEASASYTTSIKINDTTYLCNDISKPRRDICLQLMADQGYISEDERASNSGKNMIDILKPDVQEDDSAASYFKDYAVDQVIEDLMEEYNLEYEDASNMVYSGGLEIYTTMDPAAQASVEESFEDGSYFPSYTNLSKNKNGDVVTDSGDISLYNYEKYFDKDDNFILKKDEFKVNSDGSLTITAHKRLYFYVTETSEGTDYSIEFKPTYEIKDDKLYIHSGGYINIPMTEKTMAENDDITISADYIQSHPELMHFYEDAEDKYVITPEAYTLEPAVIQPQAAMVIVEVGTGELKAMVGGRGIKGSNLYNRATSTRQPGSSLKPLAVYSAALQKSFDYAEKGKPFEYIDYHIDKQGTKYYGDYLTAASTVIDEPTTIEGKKWPTNASGRYSGKITMRRALQMSVNVSAVKIYLQVGKDYSADMVEKFGITSLVRDGEYSDLNPSGLGMGGLSQGVSPLEMAQAYTTFPNGGYRNTTIAYTKVLDRYGNTMLKANSESIKVLDEGVAFIMTDMLKSVVTKGIGGNAAVKGVEVGGKTGTTSSNYDIWFDGFTPSYAAALWIGSDVNITLTSDSSSAARLWSHIMSKIPNAKVGSYKSMPANVVKYNGEYFTKGTETGLAKAPDEEDEEDLEEEEEIIQDKPNGSTNIDHEDQTPEDTGGGTGTDDTGGTSTDTGGNDSGEPITPDQTTT